MKIKNLLLISICLFSFSSFAGNGVKKVTEMDLRRFIDLWTVYETECKGSKDEKMIKLGEYCINSFSQYFVLANKIGGAEMKATLELMYEDAPKELLRRGEAEASRQGVPLLNLNRKR